MLSKNLSYMLIAKTMGKRSPCLKRQIGCVITDEQGHVLAIGYNGPPKGYPHCETCLRDPDLFPENLPACPSVHAEANALLQLEDRRFATRIYTTVFPCIECAKMIANTNIKFIFYEQEYNTGLKDKEIVNKIFEVAGIARILLKEDRL